MNDAKTSKLATVDMLATAALPVVFVGRMGTLGSRCSVGIESGVVGICWLLRGPPAAVRLPVGVRVTFGKGQ